MYNVDSNKSNAGVLAVNALLVRETSKNIKIVTLPITLFLPNTSLNGNL